MNGLSRHIVLTAVSLLASIATVWWTQPNTAAGAVFITSTIIIVFNAFGLILSRVLQPRSNGKETKAVWPILVVLSFPLVSCSGNGVAPVAAPVAALGVPLGVPLGGSNKAGGSGSSPSASSKPTYMPQPPSSSSRVNTAIGGSGSTVAAMPQLRPARAFLKAESIPPVGVGAYGVLALRSKPTSASRGRLMMACQAFLASLPPQNTLPASVKVNDQMLTIWPLTTVGPSTPQGNDCSYLLDNYDLYGGISAIQDAVRQDRRLDGRGPFLIGWSPSENRGRPDAVVLILDMSPMDSQTSFDDAFTFWQYKIVESPMLWRNGFSAERLRLALRDFADHHGQNILFGLKLWGKES